LPGQQRKTLLAQLLRGSSLSVFLNENFAEDGAIVYREACKLGASARHIARAVRRIG
jgi:hypothetical protein